LLKMWFEALLHKRLDCAVVFSLRLRASEIWVVIFGFYDPAGRSDEGVQLDVHVQLVPCIYRVNGGIIGSHADGCERVLGVVLDCCESMLGGMECWGALQARRRGGMEVWSSGGAV